MCLILLLNTALKIEKDTFQEIHWECTTRLPTSGDIAPKGWELVLGSGWKDITFYYLKHSHRYKIYTVYLRDWLMGEKSKKNSCWWGTLIYNEQGKQSL